jgi:hypothetical protein
VVAWAAVLCIAGGVRAEAGGFSLAARAGTPGLGFEAAASVTPRFNLRGGLNFLSYNRELDANLSARQIESNVHFDRHVRLKSGGLFADLYTSSSFHVTGGVIYNNSQVPLEAQPNTPVIVNDEIYTPAQLGTLNATVKLGRQWAPYAGIGFGNPTLAKRRVTFLFDLGVIFEGQPTVTMSSSVANEAGLQADVDAAAEQINREYFDKGYLKYYPVISIGVAVRF